MGVDLPQEDSYDSRTNEDGGGEATEYDPLAADESWVGIREDTEHQSDSEDSIVEVVMERCDMCGDRLETSQELVTHLARDHFQAGLYNELLDRGWDEGGPVCPVRGCEAEVEDMLTHWAGHHGRARAMVNRCLAGGEVRLREEMSFCHQFVKKWFRVDVNMKNTKEANDQINRLLHGPQENDNEIINVEPDDDEDCVIVLDDSSDDEIEIIEAVKCKKIIDDKVEQILEHITPHTNLNLEKASLLSLNTIEIKVPFHPEASPSTNILKIEERVTSPAPSPIFNSARSLSNVTTEKNINEARVETESLQEISSADISNILGPSEEPVALHNEVKKDCKFHYVEPNVTNNPQKLNIVENLFGQSIYSDNLLRQNQTNASTVNYQQSTHIDNTRNPNFVKSPVKLSQTKIETRFQSSNMGCVEVLDTSEGSDQKSEESTDIVMNPETRAREETMLRHVRPGLTQCLECLEDLGSLASLTRHMLHTKHVNISWAAQTNNGPGKGNHRYINIHRIFNYDFIAGGLRSP